MGEHTPADTVEIKVKDDENSFLMDNYLFSGDTFVNKWHW